MQNINPHRSRWIWLIAVLLLCGTVSAILWPQKYSLADPRRYVAIEDIPLRAGYEDILLNISEGDKRWEWCWDYSVLNQYGILPFDFTTASPYYEHWINWTNAYLVDFFDRIANQQPAIIRSIAGTDMDNSVCELQYEPQMPVEGNFWFTSNHLRCNANCQHLGIIKKPVTSLIIKSYPDWVYCFPPFNTNEGDGLFYVNYKYGYDAELDQQFDALLALLTEQGLLTIETQ